MQRILIDAAPPERKTRDARRAKAVSVAWSLGLHVFAFFSLMNAPTLRLPDPSPSEYQQAFAGKENKIIWYKFRQLPDVKPAATPRKNRPVKAQVKAAQSIVAAAKNAPKREIAVLAPDPAIEAPPLDLPNLIAVKLPPKTFTTPLDVAKPESAKIAAPDVPEAMQQELADVKVPATHLPPKTMGALPAQAPKQSARIALPDEAASVPAVAKLQAQELPKAHLPGKFYEAPKPQNVPTPAKIAVPTEDASATATAPMARAELPSARLPGKFYAPPPPQKNGGSATKPSPIIDGEPGDLTVAIASLKSTALPVTLPSAASPAQFSAGEKVRPNGTDSEPGKGIVVADLYAKSNKQEKPDLLAMSNASPTSREFIDRSLRSRPNLPSQPSESPVSGNPTPPPSVPRPAATRVSSAPDPRLNGREVYMMAIQMPNFTSYSGSWLMWFAPKTAQEAAAQPVVAPVAHRKVDPKYTPATIDDRVEGKVLLYATIGRDGNVSLVEVIRGADERLNRSAIEALAKWEFYPAMRSGQPIDVDVVVEVPFVLAPRTATAK